jgi:hypothetical protein
MVNDDTAKMVKADCPRTTCFDCQNARACECEKIDDENYKGIDEYGFITDGYQIYDKNGEIKSFVVSKCNNYKVDEPRKRATTREELEHLRYLKDSIKILYFDAENIDEADQIQEDLRNRHQIYDYDANSLTDRKTR